MSAMEGAALRHADLLATIVAATRKTVELRAGREPLSQLERQAAAVQARPGVFREALRRSDRINVIAECKRRSPSRGVLREDYDPAAIARAYEAAGAAAVSVLTEPTFFDGSLDHLRQVRQASQIPVLRKDFIVDAYQIYEARAAGADAVLLIAAAVTEGELCALHACAIDAGLDVLVEVHDVSELGPALAAGAEIIGVNNRDLRTLTLSIETSRLVIERIPSGVVAVAESGLRSAGDIMECRRAGYSAFLVGEHLMTSPDPGGALRALLAAAGAEG